MFKPIVVVATLITATGGLEVAQDAVDVAHNHFVTSDGVRLHYLEAGSGEPMVFVPGWRMPAAIFERQIDFFAKSHRVLAFDPRGHGGSEAATEGFYRERRARDIEEFLNAASVESAVLVGWSMGIPELLAFVQQFGTARARALVLVDFPFRFGSDFQAFAGELLVRYLRDPDTVARELLPGFFSTPQDQEWLEEMTRVSRAMPTSSAIAVMFEYVVEGGDWSTTLQSLDRPLLYAVSPAYASDADELGRLVPNAVTRVFEGAQHGFFFDRHEEFNQAVSDFVHGL